jgi:GT2 family glycosyltransferase
MKEGIDLSISIISTNERHHLVNLLPTINPSCTTHTLEVFVIDNASTDGTTKLVREKYPEFNIIRQDKKKGFSSNNNKALQQSSGDLFLVLNPDTRLPEHGLDSMIEFHKSHNEAGLSTALLINPDGSIQYTARRFPKPSAVLLRYLGIDNLWANNPISRRYLLMDWDRSDVRSIDWSLGAFLLGRRDFLLSLNGFDETFDPLYYEDIDLCFRVKKAGKQVLFNPDVRITHEYHRESAKGCFNKMTYYHLRNILRFFSKNGIPVWK